eukprot:12807612-Prorocentrum_lima.AAC.1
MATCGHFASDNQPLYETTSTHNVDVGLLRIMMRMTNGRNETLTTIGIAIKRTHQQGCSHSGECAKHSRHLGNC